jgi:hypothetical protein
MEPHANEDQLMVGVKIRDEAFTPAIPDDCDPTLREVMQMCWQKNPEDRPVCLLSYCYSRCIVLLTFVLTDYGRDCQISAQTLKNSKLN